MALSYAFPLSPFPPIHSSFNFPFMIFLAPGSKMSPPQSDPEFYSVTYGAAGAVGGGWVGGKKRQLHSLGTEEQNHLSAPQPRLQLCHQDGTSPSPHPQHGLPADPRNPYLSPPHPSCSLPLFSKPHSRAPSPPGAGGAAPQPNPPADVTHFSSLGFKNVEFRNL